MSAKKTPLFTSLKTKTVRERRGRPELTMQQRIESDRRIVDLVWAMLDERTRAGDKYRKARGQATLHAAEVTALDESVIRKTWKRWEWYYRAQSTLRAESTGKKIDE